MHLRSKEAMSKQNEAQGQLDQDMVILDKILVDQNGPIIPGSHQVS